MKKRNLPALAILAWVFIQPAMAQENCLRYYADNNVAMFRNTCPTVQKVCFCGGKLNCMPHRDWRTGVGCTVLLSGEETAMPTAITERWIACTELQGKAILTGQGTQRRLVCNTIAQQASQ